MAHAVLNFGSVWMERVVEELLTLRNRIDWLPVASTVGREETVGRVKFNAWWDGWIRQWQETHQEEADEPDCHDGGKVNVSITVQSRHHGRLERLVNPSILNMFSYLKSEECSLC